MKRLNLDELSKEIVKIAYDYDTYEFKDNFENYDDAYEYTLHTLFEDASYIWAYLNELAKSMDADDYNELDYEHIINIQNQVYDLCI